MKRVIVHVSNNVTIATSSRDHTQSRFVNWYCLTLGVKFHPRCAISGVFHNTNIPFVRTFDDLDGFTYQSIISIGTTPSSPSYKEWNKKKMTTYSWYTVHVHVASTMSSFWNYSTVP